MIAACFKIKCNSDNIYHASYFRSGKALTEYCTRTGTVIDPSVINLKKPRVSRKSSVSNPPSPKKQPKPMSGLSLLRNLGNSISIIKSNVFNKSRGENGFSPKKSGIENGFSPKKMRMENGFRPKESENQEWSMEETDRGTRILKHRMSGVALELYNTTKDPETPTPIKGPNTKVISYICAIST